MRRIEGLSDGIKPAPIGHNGGPPLDLSWNAWAWRRAHAKAWTSPGREIVLLRLRRAERLGLSYREYTSVLMDRGVHLGGLVVLMDGALADREMDVTEKLATLHDCRMLVCAARASAEFSSRLRRAGAELALATDMADGETLAPTIRAFALRAQLPPGALFMIGDDASRRRIAERAGLTLYVDARRYFGIAL